ncbi:MAG: response regulator transcription factor [Saprospiraceae bacterium]|nr:response regulator transcription factor [Saprospiraceae bacterium]
MIKVILVDDENLCLDVLETLIKEYMPALKIIGRFQNGEEAIPVILNGQPDIIFLDIEMPIMNGFELLDRLKPYNFNVIFTTAHDDLALKAYKYDVKNYLLKPITLSDLNAAVQRLIAKMPQPQKVDNQPIKLSFSTHEGTYILSPDDILFCEADDSYCVIHQVNSKKIIVSKTLKEIEFQLAPYYFYRQHHSYLINIKHLIKYYKGEGSSVILKGDIELPISRVKEMNLLDS